MSIGTCMGRVIQPVFVVDIERAQDDYFGGGTVWYEISE